MEDCMSQINTGKVLVGGLVAAIVFFAIDSATYGFIMKEAYDANMVRLGLDPAAMSGAPAMIGWVVSELVFGFLVVFTYAGLRPRFGPGVKTAVYAGLLPFLYIFMVLWGQTQGGLMTTSLFWQGAFFGLISILAGSVAGAWVYKE
jgi:hypothetical protein